MKDLNVLLFFKPGLAQETQQRSPLCRDGGAWQALLSCSREQWIPGLCPGQGQGTGRLLAEGSQCWAHSRAPPVPHREPSCPGTSPHPSAPASHTPQGREQPRVHHREEKTLLLSPELENLHIPKARPCFQNLSQNHPFVPVSGHSGAERGKP